MSNRTRTPSTADAAIKSIVLHWEPDELFAAAEAMERLQNDPDFGRLLTLVTEGRENAQQRLVNGPTLDQAGYTRALGFISGLDVVREIPRAIQEAAAVRERQLESRSEIAEAGGE